MSAFFPDFGLKSLVVSYNVLINELDKGTDPLEKLHEVFVFVFFKIKTCFYKKIFNQNVNK